MLTRDEIRETRKESITEMITNMGFERDSFMYCPQLFAVMLQHHYKR